ncbi:glycogen debranching enzyme GlgX [Roseobacter denitrificans]|uniref:Glycogen debranching enzyme n=1 Tax=Roseobacter denitrificans (strain ATCC 33942 / OCh 114) TaxID=375451 RepID=Q165E5_ROSDO|nr:glycogen debranching protein GlgX [Roseobacter denitrificans]ABG32398.1 glycogen debranching enzyme [Roseobacter denitrificans OCh 114]AVL51868.1 glycogen debranching enzyme GlgX [Roseobacter denitrificans]SFF81288.1 glycogen operon protein [Roseobacter denitrificans OCh 114]
MDYHFTSGNPTQLGAHHDGQGVNFAVFSAHASAIELCLFTPDGHTETARLALPERSGDIWHGYLPGLAVGTVYGYRAHGPYAPEQGHRFNPNKLLLDPYTRQLCGAFKDDPALLGYVEGDAEEDLSFDPRDSAPYVAKSVVRDPAIFPKAGTGPQIPWEETLIYEAHVKGLTAQNDRVPADLRGTYDALASDAMLAHFKRLGITAVELLPVHAFVNDSFLLKKGLTNYWGYNTIGFFAPEPRYVGPAGIAGFQKMVQRLHAAGIEVILDVVYNHTAEGDQRGPTLSFRGLDNASYYRLTDADPRFYVNDTGTGNTLNVAHPQVLRMVLDSLRFWVEHMGVDGFRFDLATTLAREPDGFDPQGGFMDALRQDPVLGGVKLIAEPWDIGPGGYQLGAYPPEFAEWNDAYRDTVRRFWKGDSHSAQDLAARLLGSAEIFDHRGRRAWSSLNFLAAHDGFTLADTTSYARRHNQANGEGNRDGHHGNHSDSCGVEGPTTDPDILARRARRQRNMLATLFLSQGTPMLLAGDEMGNSQAGNNNAYCQDNAIGWVDWQADQAGLFDFVQQLSAFRAAHPVLRQSRFLHGAARVADGRPDVEWSDATGAAPDWHDPDLSTFCLMLRGSAEASVDTVGDDAVLVVINRAPDPVKIALPPPPTGQCWQIGMRTGAAARGKLEAGELVVEAEEVMALILSPMDAPDAW